jgi:hypothetical protein
MVETDCGVRGKLENAALSKQHHMRINFKGAPNEFYPAQSITQDIVWRGHGVQLPKNVLNRAEQFMRRP